jgi:hypothetical protein
MLVSIPASGRAASTSKPTSSSSTRSRRPSDISHRARPEKEFRTSTPINAHRLQNHLPGLGLSTPNSSSLPRFPSPIPKIHKRTKPRVSLGDFHDQPPDLIDVERDYPHGHGGKTTGPQGSSPFAPFKLERNDEVDPDLDIDHDLDLDFELDLGVDENMLDPSSILSLHPHPSSKRGQRGLEPELESQVEASESDTYALAKCYFDTKELERCKRVLQGCRSKKAMFLRLYAVYLVGNSRLGFRRRG